MIMTLPRMTTPPASLHTLPPELILLIASFLPTDTLHNPRYSSPRPRQIDLSAVSALSRTCHSLHNLLTPALDSLLGEHAKFFANRAVRRHLPSLLRRVLRNSKHDIRGNLSHLLLDAVPRGTEDIVRVLLNHGADPNVRSHHGPLFRAVTSNRREMVKMLVEAGANMEGRPDYISHVMYCVRQWEDTEMQILFSSLARRAKLKNKEAKVEA